MSEDLKKMWREEERKKKLQAKLDKANEARPGYEPRTVKEFEAQSDWGKLAITADLKFPSHLTEKFNLKPEQRLVAIAHCIGWDNKKIAIAAGMAESTVSRWLNQNDLILAFIDAFKYHTGSASTKSLIDQEQYASLETLKLLRDDPSVSASTRKEIAIWMLEQKLGKAKESKEIKGINLRDLTEQLKKSQATLLEELDEDSLEEVNPSDPN